MRPRTVVGVDGREWIVRASADWLPAAVGDDFEHDVSSNSGAWVVFGWLGAVWGVLILWAWPMDIVIPWFFWVGMIAVLGFFPARWWLRRPRSVVAETPGANEYPAERWQGQVRGLAKTREELRIIVRRLRTQGTPAHADSPLSPMDQMITSPVKPTLAWSAPPADDKDDVVE